jgi:hypothetical protein
MFKAPEVTMSAEYNPISDHSLQGTLVIPIPKIVTGSVLRQKELRNGA